MERRFDLVILGAGSTAFAAALAAKELGKTVLMTEERPVGGTCVNRGCLPSKNLIEAARLVHGALHPRYPGLTPCKLEVDFRALVDQKDDLVHEYRGKKYESLLGSGVSVERGHARFVDPHTVEVGGKRFAGEKMLIATGSRPEMPAIAGLESVPYLTSDLLSADESMELRELPRSMLIVGGGFVALELGQMLSRFGTEVTIFERSAQLLSRGYEPEIGPIIQQVLDGEGIRVVLNASLTEAWADSGGVVATALVGGETSRFQAENILVAAGRRANTDEIGIENAGVRVAPRGWVAVDECLRTSVPHIFAAGDVIGQEVGSQMATPVGARDGGIAAHNALSGLKLRKVDHRVVPRVIFTDPEIAVVGMTEAEARAAGHECWCNALPMSLVPRAAATRQTHGLVKIVADKRTGEVLGVSMVGHNAGEVIHEAAMGLRFHATLDDFVDLLHVYPAMAEALKIAALSRFKDPRKLSCCAE